MDELVNEFKSNPSSSYAPVWSEGGEGVCVDKQP
jgi:hypothetical protein